MECVEGYSRFMAENNGVEMASLVRQSPAKILRSLAHPALQCVDDWDQENREACMAGALALERESNPDTVRISRNDLALLRTAAQAGLQAYPSARNRETKAALDRTSRA